MAEAILSVVLDQLTSFVRIEVAQEVQLVVGVREELQNLETKLRLVKAVLEDAEKKEIHDNAVKVWLGQLKDVMYDAEDVLDEWNTRILISANGPHVANRVRFYLLSLCACFKHLGVRHDIAHGIKGIREGLDMIALSKDQLGLVQSHSHEEPRQLTSSVVDVSVIFGRDHDKRKILGKLLCETSQQETQVPTPILSIVGTAGFGKTTLGQLVYNEETITTTFELKKIWVCVSDPFDRERVAREIIAQATTEKLPENVVGWELLHQHLCNSVKGKRFLLVLDDVWTEDSNCWEPLKLSLNGGERGSKIIVTTRNEKVAKMIGSTYIHRLVELSEDDCWHMFRQIAFCGRSEEECQKLKGIGQELAKKCKGVPLAVKTLASLMRCKQAKEDWMGVLESDIWETQVEGFLPAILLSYHALPSVLKRCFMYCAIFPKDHKMEKDQLVKLWMAQGYLGSDRARELERVGAEYFDALAMRSFFQDFEKDDDGIFFKCKMHDLVHDFAQFLTKADCSVLVNNEKIISQKIHHLTVDDVENPSIYEVKKLRTLVAKSSTLVPSALHQLTCLRTLDLSYKYSDPGLEVLPSEVSRLLHLRYLDLSFNTRLKELPETVRSLVNLQILKLNRCYDLCKLPEGIGELSNLRHLEVEGTGNLKYYPRGGIERLSQLRTLSKFVVSVGSSKGSVIEELGNLNFLKGRLCIMGLRHVKSVNEAKQVELHKKKNISALMLNFGYELYRPYIGHVSSEEEIRRMEGVLENLEPHKESLERLEIYNYVGSTLPTTWTMMSNITYLDLCNCPNLKVEPHYLFPPRLETLVLQCRLGVLSKSLMSLTHNNNNLKSLSIYFFPHSSLPQGLNQLTSLQQLTFRGCQYLDFKPEELKPLTMLRKLVIRGCSERSREEDWSILTHIPNIEIDWKDIKSRN